MFTFFLSKLKSIFQYCASFRHSFYVKYCLLLAKYQKMYLTIETIFLSEHKKTVEKDLNRPCLLTINIVNFLPAAAQTTKNKYLINKSLDRCCNISFKEISVCRLLKEKNISKVIQFKNVSSSTYHKKTSLYIFVFTPVRFYTNANIIKGHIRSAFCLKSLFLKYICNLKSNLIKTLYEYQRYEDTNFKKDIESHIWPLLYYNLSGTSIYKRFWNVNILKMHSFRLKV